jgi:uncharacterized membrane protein YhiD involved in acid resistance
MTNISRKTGLRTNTVVLFAEALSSTIEKILSEMPKSSTTI